MAPEASEGEGTGQRSSLTSPSVWQVPATSPWRGRIDTSNDDPFAQRVTMACRYDAAYGMRMTTAADLDALTALDQAATPGPWYVRAMDDENATCATAVATKPNTSGDNDDLSSSTYHGVVAATSIQHHDYIVPADGRSRENAALIAAVRTALPELLRLARIGAAADRA
ncbi:hypothetical protein C8J40_101595 [Sphingomonas sp. PP-CC-3A-396]|nr:hypothetical protein C8J40_101595 [Sphingomonas sp. PP-CC-3A-396]